MVEVVEASFYPAARIKIINYLAAYGIYYARFQPMEFISAKNRPMGFICPYIKALKNTSFNYLII
jgi:hypothetical protein